MTKYKYLAPLFGAAMLLSMALPASASSLTTNQIDAIIGLLKAFNADSVVIANVQAQLSGQAISTSSVYYSSWSCNTFVNLKRGDTDDTTKGQVSKLQDFLGMTVVGIYGPLTQAAWNSRCEGTHSTPSTPSTPSITVLLPNATVKFGSMYTVSWSAQNIPANANLAFSLIASNGTAYRINDEVAPAVSGSFQWTMNGVGCWGTQCAENVMKVGDSFKVRAQIYTPANSCYDGQWSGGACPSGTPTATIVAEDQSDQTFWVVQ